jgi:hypothetical protein
MQLRVLTDEAGLLRLDADDLHDVAQYATDVGLHDGLLDCRSADYAALIPLLVAAVQALHT